MPPSGSPNASSQTNATPQRPTRRYKTQLRDFLSTCRSKRKLQQSQQQQHQSNSNMGQVSSIRVTGNKRNADLKCFCSVDNTTSSCRRIYTRSSCCCCCIHKSKPDVCNIAVPIVHRQSLYDTVGAFIKLLSGHWKSLPSVSAARCRRLLFGRLSSLVGANAIRKWISAVRWLWPLNQRRKMARWWRKILSRSWYS